MFIAMSACLCLAIILLLYDEEEQLVAIPMACMIGWVQLPPTFCTLSETIADVTNTKMEANSQFAKAHVYLEAQAAHADNIHSMHALSPLHEPEEDEIASNSSQPLSHAKMKRF
jgi:hypothetical protein